MGPLTGVRVIEIAGIGPGPFCAMMLSDMGAEVVRIDRRTAAGQGSKYDVLNRGRRSLALDLKKPDAVETVLRMVERADVLMEGFRPGVMERLGMGPDVCLTRNPRLVFGRMTGWGQEGPLALAAGHRGSKPIPELSIETSVEELAAWSQNPPELGDYRKVRSEHQALVDKVEAFRVALEADEREYTRQQEKRAEALARVRDEIAGGVK